MSDQSPTDSAHRIRIILGNLDGVFAEVLAAMIAAQPDMDLGPHAQGAVEILVGAGSANIVILGAPMVYPPPGLCGHLLLEYSDLRVLVVSPNGADVALYWLGLRRRRVYAPTHRSLLRLIRDAYALNAAE